MSASISLEAKSRKKAIGDDGLIFKGSEDAERTGSFSESSDSSSDSDSDSSSGSVRGFEPGTKPGNNDSQPSRDELLAYLEDMRRRFSAKQMADSFAEQDEVLIVTPKEKSDLAYILRVPGLMHLAGISQD